MREDIAERISVQVLVLKVALDAAYLLGQVIVVEAVVGEDARRYGAVLRVAIMVGGEAHRIVFEGVLVGLYVLIA